MRGIIFTCVVLLFAAAGCGKKEEVKKPVAFSPYVADSISKMVELAEGLKVTKIKEGVGPKPVVGGEVVIHYTAYLKEGNKEFDSSFKRGEPLHFVYGQKQIIEGLEIGISTMRMGGKAIIEIPASLAYGSKGLEPNIPANSALIYHVELLGNF